MANVLVIGGMGFIGSHLVERLVAEGHAVRVLDSGLTGREENLEGVRERVMLQREDIRDSEAVGRVVKDMDYVFHLAALPSVPHSIQDPLTAHDINVNGTLNVLLAAKEEGVRRVIYASSSSVYGDTPILPKHEEMALLPMSPYAAQKLMGEHYCRIFTEVYGLETVSLRYFNVFGPRQDPLSEYAAVIPRFITAFLKERSPVIYGDGEQSRDFSFIDNVVEANLLAMQAPEAAGEAFNIASAIRVTLNELLGKIREVLGVDTEARNEPSRPGDIRHSLADIRKAKRVLGYHPTITWEEGIEKTIAYYRLVHSASSEGAPTSLSLGIR